MFVCSVGLVFGLYLLTQVEGTQYPNQSIEEMEEYLPFK